MEHEEDGNTRCRWCASNGPQGLREGTGRIGNQGKSWDLADHSIDKISLNTEKSLGDGRTLSVT